MRSFYHTYVVLILALGLTAYPASSGAQVLTLTVLPQLSPTPTDTPTPPLFITPNPTVIALATPTSTLPPGITPMPTLAALSTDTPTPSYSITPISGNATETPTPTLPPVHFPTPLFLGANFFNPNTNSLDIHFQMNDDGQAKISIFNMAGELVKTVLDEFHGTGQYVAYWEGRNNSGDLVGNAVYYIIFQYPGGQTIQKVILLK